MSLSIAAALADDKAPGGFQTKAVAAMVSKAQAALVSEDTPPSERAYAGQFLRNPEAWARAVVWVVLSVPEVHASATPADSLIVTAAASRWNYFARIGAS